MLKSIASVAAPTSALELLLLGMRSSLFTESAMKQFLDRHPAPSLPDLDAAARLLVADKLVSKFQAELLLLGHPEGLTLGRYRLVDLIGKGGMGRVFLAIDPQLHRRVAVKVLSAEADRADLRGRFLRETRAAAALVHPNVVAAYDSGEQGGALFLVMEYVSGITLHAKVFQNGPLPIPLACDYVRQAALGLAAVHAAGLIHRDVKPSNLIVTDDGVVKLLDLGLARFIEPTHPEDGPLTLMHNLGQVLGTPQFLAPEQQARSDQADHRSDIFGLGAVLFFLLTGRYPLPGSSLDRTPLPTILTVSQTLPNLPRELSRLLSRLLATDPANRPQKAEEAAAELAAFCCEPASSSDEQLLPTRRRRLRRAAIFAGLLASAGGAFFALHPPSVPPATEEPHCVVPPVPAAIAEAPAPRLAPILRDRGLLCRREKPLTGVALSPDGRLAATASMDGNTVLWDVLGERPPVLIPGPGSRSAALAFSPDGNHLLFGLGRTSVGVWDVAAGKIVDQIEHKETITTAAMNEDGSLLAVGDRLGTVTLFDRKQQVTRAFRPLGTITGVSALAFRPGQASLLCGYQFPNRVMAWAYTEPMQTNYEVAPAASMMPNGIKPFPDGRRVAAVGASQVSLLDLQKREYVRLIPSGESEVLFGCVAVGPSGKWIVTGGQHGWVRVWDAESGAELAALGVHQGKSSIIVGIALTADGKTAVTACSDGSARLLRLNVPE